jgi:tRNA (guanine37-N1)-methyltransferase
MNDKEKLQSKFIKLENKDGQKLIDLMNRTMWNKSILEKKYKVIHENDFIFFPLIEDVDMIAEFTSFIKSKLKFEIISMKAALNPNYKQKNLLEFLQDKIPKEYLNLIPKSFDIIGNLAIIEFERLKKQEIEDLANIKTEIANAILNLNKNVVSVYEKKSQIKEVHRIRELELLGGKNLSETIHKENNCSFRLDIKQTFFTPRLVFERNRVASSNIKENEIIVDLFAGVGPFSIQIAKLHNVRVFSFDINPRAYNFLKENINNNKLKGKIFPFHLDIKNLLDLNDELGNQLKNTVNRIIMNLPEKSIDYIEVACFLMNEKGGILHFYDFSEKPNPVDNTKEKLSKELSKLNWKIDKILESKIVKAFSPKSDLVVFDLVIKSINS